ncbi:MAG: hypothetical protein KGS61_01755, partial [Verrucomicrobia bacterium]|nr:hypothetical protein [Verrucomicrobiota bacterium]
MKRHSQHGVALVITLIMLAVVTLMAITFLAISRRGRTSVQVTVDQTDARTMADAALARAQAEAVARMIASSNPFNYGLMVSTNYLNPFGFAPGLSSPNNVNYDQRIDGSPLNQQDRIRNIGNLFYAPRPPVYVDTNGNGAYDFRFYLDLNRNGKFESNGWQHVLNDLGYWTTVNGAPLSNYFVGDPEWVGVLEHPDQPHSGTNRFLGRYAYIALPMGKSLDLNFMHNQAKTLGPAAEGFSRNQGVGSWELNLAAFLCDLNTNVWGNYLYNPTPGSSSPALAAQDAMLLLRPRYAWDYTRLPSVVQNQTAGAVGAGAVNAFLNSQMDVYGSGPIMTGEFPPPLPPALMARPWPGSDNPQSYYDAQQLFSLGNNAIASLVNPLTALTRRLQAIASIGRSSYNRYTFYRLLGQLGVDSTPSLAGRMNINFINDASGNVTNFVPWTPLGFFTNAANRLLQASLTTNFVPVTPTLYLTNFSIGDTLVRSNINVTDIMLYPTNEYTSSIHRLLQLAANIYDATTNRVTVSGYPYVPSIFRPIFRRTMTNNIPVVSIAGYTEETNTLFLSYPRIDLTQLLARPPGLYPAVLLYGQPLVIGAKKGFPNLNEWNVQTSLRITRKLLAVKSNPKSLPNLTNQMYLLAITNLAGVEAWNSYVTNYPRQLLLHVEDRCTLRLNNQAGSPLLFVNVGMITNQLIPPKAWGPLQFQVPVATNFVLLTNETYTPFGFVTNQIWDSLNRGMPLWTLSITNRLIYYVYDTGALGTARLIDYASFSSVQQDTNVMQTLLLGLRNTPMALFWQLGPNGSAMPGITNQIMASTGRLPLPPAIWTSADFSPWMGYDKQKSMAFFEDFLYGYTTGSNRVYDIESLPQNQKPLFNDQAPFSPSPILYYVERGQANDPLVHYVLSDLQPGVSTNVWPANIPPYFELGTT